MNDRLKIIDSVLDTPRPISIHSENEERRDYLIKQPTFRQILEISKIMLQINVTDISEFLNGKKAFEFMFKYVDKIIEIISIALKEPDKEFLKSNLTPAEAYDVILNILQLVGVQDFQKSIIQLSSVSLLNQRELIALSTHLRT